MHMKTDAVHSPNQAAIFLKTVVVFLIISCASALARQVTVDGVGYTRDDAIRTALRAELDDLKPS